MKKSDFMFRVVHAIEKRGIKCRFGINQYNGQPCFHLTANYIGSYFEVVASVIRALLIKAGVTGKIQFKNNCLTGECKVRFFVAPSYVI